MRRILDGIHLVHLGLLPALATLSALVAHGHAVPALLFFVGIVVSVYLAVVISYTSPRSCARAESDGNNALYLLATRSGKRPTGTA
jgi:hypothetical protein